MGTIIFVFNLQKSSAMRTHFIFGGAEELPVRKASTVTGSYLKQWLTVANLFI
jgi:hypothetical protein